MNAEPKVSVHPDSGLLAASVAARLVTRLVDVQNERGTATVVLTGGTLGIGALRAVAESPARSAVNWSAVDFWWGDERFLPADHSDRNAVQARAALLDELKISPNRVHEFGAAGDFENQDDAAVDYARRLQEAADKDAAAEVELRDPRLPRFDILLLGVGPDAHIASLFPEMAGIRAKGQTVIGVTGSPKPPPERVSLTLEAINSAEEIWLAVAGQDKAGAVGLALAGAGPVQVPAAGARGHKKTLWLIDQEAASQLPGRLIGSEEASEDGSGNPER
ncbi:6-phosphogluconolactonase [Arthrobacter pigmenti]|uniref:6-phosphogluconolactonase n=1 Tax=Arthrobacter pigmenti TaxID=271432 RepID=A0A846RRF6_9MICC|nr:6-phosphogluconolactonase [Arthrobacter pigmenti]